MALVAPSALVVSPPLVGDSPPDLDLVMALLTPYDRIQQLIRLIDLNPSIKQVVRFLSKHLDPFGEITGVSWMALNHDSHFDYLAISGLQTKMDATVRVALSDDNAVAESFRLGKMQIWDMKIMYASYSDATHKDDLSVFPCGLAMPLTDRMIVGCALSTPVSDLQEYLGYFECIRLVLAFWQEKSNFDGSDFARRPNELKESLTGRQEEVLAMIKEGKTNSTIAVILGFSESLIRQETIIIYRKMGVSGRKDLIIHDSSKRPTKPLD